LYLWNYLAVFDRVFSDLFVLISAICVRGDMGIGLVAWRCAIGSFSHFGPYFGCVLHLSGFAHSSRVTPRLACIIAVLLAVGGVELNPGPTKLEDIAHRIDDLFTELRDTRASLALKIDDSVRDITTKLRSCEDLLTATVERVVAVETAHTAMATELATLRASVAALGASAVPSASLPAIYNRYAICDE
jgi:hypothetical protein